MKTETLNIETLEDAANNYKNGNWRKQIGEDYSIQEVNIEAYINGANWQKEQYKPLIESHGRLIRAFELLLKSHWRLSGGIDPTDIEALSQCIIEKAKQITI